MNDKTKHDFILLFNQGFEEIVLPEIEAIRDDVGDLKKTVSGLDKRVGSLETRVGQMDNKLDHFSDKVIEHESVLKQTQSIPVIAHELKRKRSK